MDTKKIKPIDILNNLKNKNIFDYELIIDNIYEKINFEILPHNVINDSLNISITIKEHVNDYKINWNFFDNNKNNDFLYFILDLITIELNKDNNWSDVAYHVNNLKLNSNNRSIDVTFLFTAERKFR